MYTNISHCISTHLCIYLSTYSCTYVFLRNKHKLDTNSRGTVKQIISFLIYCTSVFIGFIFNLVKCSSNVDRHWFPQQWFYLSISWEKAIGLIWTITMQKGSGVYKKTYSEKWHFLFIPATLIMFYLIFPSFSESF